MLRHRADLRTLSLLALLTACYAALFVTGAPWLWAPCAVLAVTACAAKHNHTHRAMFSRRWANRLLDLWLMLCTGTSTSGIRVPHQLRHHGENQSPADFVRCSLVAGRSPLAALLTFAPRVVAEAWRRRAEEQPHRHATSRACRLERVALWAFMIGALCVDWRAFLLTFPLPWLASQWFLLTMNLPQHDGCDAASRWAHSRDATGRLANWLCLNNGFHTAHHEAPALHWSCLPDLHARAIAPHLPADHAYPSLLAFWAGWWRWRRRSRVVEAASAQQQPALSRP